MRRIRTNRSAIRRCQFAFAQLGPLVLLIFTCCIAVQDAGAQTGGGGGVGGGGNVPVDGGGIGGGNAGGDNGGDFGGNTGAEAGTGGDNDSGAFGDDPAFGEVLGGVDTTDVRNQGFVGSTGPQIQEGGFVGPPGEFSGPPLADGASFGGGVNDVNLAAGGGGGNQNRNAGFGGVGQQGQVKGFEVFRSSVRANLRQQFTSPNVPGYQIADRFQNRIQRLPNMGSDGTGVRISIEGKIATMAGYVRSAEESSRIERQLRLEPGVYKIENRTQIAGQ